MYYYNDYYFSKGTIIPGQTDFELGNLTSASITREQDAVQSNTDDRTRINQISQSGSVVDNTSNVSKDGEMI